MTPSTNAQLSQPTHYQSLLRKTFDDKIPFSAHVELTYRCNLSCVHCYATDRQKAGEMSTAEIRDALRQLQTMGCLFLTFTGGEVFCRGDSIDLLAYARQLGFAITLFTNGTLLTGTVIRQLADIGLLSVEMSLYATDPSIHDAITRRPGSCAETMNALRVCAGHGMRVAVKTILMTANVDEFDSIAAFAAGIDARHVFDFVMAPADDGSRPMDRYGLSPDRIERFVAAYRDRARTPPDVPRGNDPVCGAGSNTLCITPNGDLLPCLAIRKPVGNLRERSILDLWRSPLLDEVRALRYDALKSCSRCPDLRYCTRCSGVAFAECGDLSGKSTSACTVAGAMRCAIGPNHEDSRCPRRST